MNKENEILQNKLNIVLKEKEDLFISLENTKKDFDSYKVSCKAKFSSIDENEISIMKEN